MKVEFQNRPWDLYLTVAYTQIVTALVVSSAAGGLYAILLVLLCPGYVTTAVLFPEDGGIDWIERLAISFGMSVVVVPFLGLLLMNLQQMLAQGPESQLRIPLAGRP